MGPRGTGPIRRPGPWARADVRSVGGGIRGLSSLRSHRLLRFLQDLLEEAARSRWIYFDSPTDRSRNSPIGRDTPDCSCFVHLGAWNPSGASIQAIATDTLDTQVSCSVDDGGKPYYQMVLGSNSETEALILSQLISTLEPLGLIPFHQREAWCSETISYWHREAGIPYSGGYTSFWHHGWQNYSVGEMKTWYVIEQTLIPILLHGRGRWIESTDLDYDNFVPGVTAPAPGSYVAQRGYDAGTSTWAGTSTTHSLMIDEMWIRRNFFGKIYRVEVSLLQGNSGTPARVRTGHWDDLLAITPGGSDWLGSSLDKKIYGFGIDLDAIGNPIYDSARLHYVDDELPTAAKPVEPVTNIRDPAWNDSFAPLIPALKSYTALAARSGGPGVTSSSPRVPVEGIPDRAGTRWNFPADLREDVEIVIDLLDVHPLPVRGIEISWNGAFVPAGYGVQFAATEQSYRNAQVPDLSSIRIPPGDPAVPVPVSFSGDPSARVSVRYVKLAFPSGTFKKAATIEEIGFIYAWPPWDDSPKNPVEGEFKRGYINADREVNIADPICLLGYLFGGPNDPCGALERGCLDAADVNDSGEVDIADVVRLLGHLFADTGPLPPPFGTCGIDPTEDTLDCSSFGPCQ